MNMRAQSKTNYFMALGLAALCGGTLLLAPAPAIATEPMVLASTAASDKRFFELRRAQNAAPVKVRKVASGRRSGLHSDNNSLRDGFMRIDRTMIVYNRNSKKSAAAETAAEEVANVGLIKPEGTLSNDPILDLFGTDGAAEAAAEFGVTRRGERLNHGPYAWPVAGNVAQRISSGYGMRKDPFTGKPAFHGGIDIAAAKGTKVLAAASGTVKDVSTSKRYGKFVSIEHSDGHVSWYGHLSGQSVKAGQAVRKGQTIGAVGSTGRSTGSHLDFRIKNGDKFVNPSVLLSGAPRGITLANASATR